MEEKEVATTPAEEVNKPEETETPEERKEPEAPAPKEPETPAEPTIGDALKVEEKKQPDSVPLARLNKEIARKKELEAEIEKLKSQTVDENLSKKEISSSLKDLAVKHNIDADFLSELAGAIRKEADADIEERLRPLNEREKNEKIDKAFQTGFTKAMENMPEYDGIVNANVIKKLSLDPENANKTFRQLIEDTYGNSLSGKRTIETTTPRGGNTAGNVDIEKARTDPAYFKEVMADPDLKKQYNDGLAQRIAS